MPNYIDTHLTEGIINDTECHLISVSSSHESILYGAGCHFYGFDDPRPGFSGRLYPREFFLNEQRTEIKGVNLYCSDGKYCCSYLGNNYDELCAGNREDKHAKEMLKYKDLYIKEGSKVEVIRPTLFSFNKKIIYDTKKIDWRFRNGVQLENQDSEYYKQYSDVKSPINGTAMRCIAVYTNNPDDGVHKTRKVQYVEFKDDNADRVFHYESDPKLNVDQQIDSDREKIDIRIESERRSAERKKFADMIERDNIQKTENEPSVLNNKTNNNDRI